MKKVNECLLGGIFKYIANEGQGRTSRTMPWDTKTNITTSMLDMEYMLNHSGEKLASPLLNKISDQIDSGETRFYSLGDLIYNMNIKRWSDEFKTMYFEYNPIENYSMVETHTGTETTTQTPNNWKATSTSENTDNEAETLGSTFAFNSTSEVARDKTTTETKAKNETEQSGTFETELEHDTELKRSGNIGVTTSQQMIQSERDLAMWDYFRTIVFPDIDKHLCLSIYG